MIAFLISQAESMSQWLDMKMFKNGPLNLSELLRTNKVKKAINKERGMTCLHNFAGPPANLALQKTQ